MYRSYYYYVYYYKEYIFLICQAVESMRGAQKDAPGIPGKLDILWDTWKVTQRSWGIWIIYNLYI